MPEAPMPDILSSDEASLERAQTLLTWVWDHYLYKTDPEQYGRRDHWSGALTQLLEVDMVQDDCDGFGRLMLDLCRMLGGFAASDCAEILTDTVPGDDKPLDHHICAVRISGHWHYMHCWVPLVLSESEVISGGYPLPPRWFADGGQGRTARGMPIVSHRPLDRGNDSWLPGPPVS